ncbi:VanZ family protein [Amycolatopsis azurea]|uniref:VanZ family protein n=1 Tax=Amycolatopsis azurea DSM 43854 TaxID=1238180 RepID=M2Q8F5_9PSEU|nr:VanZ family protein [Amycolatopsis azurea]EMD22382.1 VanZ like protein [Amycolatopsis azurea DSM 43854]OOC01212.1 VanZ family protein [Amycolatopsis azurea DSM 43854]
MITNFLLDHSALVPVAILLVALLCAVLGLLFAGRRRILWALAGVSLVPVFALTLVPTGRTIDEIVCTVQFSLPTLGAVELLANVALFLPPVCFAALASRRPLAMLAAGSALSAVIEALQALVPAIGRACDTNDWLMNTLGAILGALLAAGTARPANRRAQSGSSTGAMSS